MKLNGTFVVREIAGDTIIVPVGETALRFNGMITINKTGAVLWEVLEKGGEKEDLVRALTDRFEVTEEEAQADVEEFLEKMEAQKLIVG